jgi:hypothetical protein
VKSVIFDNPFAEILMICECLGEELSEDERQDLVGQIGELGHCLRSMDTARDVYRGVRCVVAAAGGRETQ